MTKVLCIGTEEGEGGSEQQQHHSGSGSYLQKLSPSFWGLAPYLTFALGEKLFITPCSFFSDPTQPPWPPSSVFLLLDTVLYCTVPWTLCLLFSGIYHVAKCLLSLIFSQVDCNGGRVLLQKPAKSYFLQRAPASIETFRWGGISKMTIMMMMIIMLIA